MKKNYTDTDIQKLLVELAEFVPEINPNDTEWREFLREFIAARPDIQLDAAFEKEIRYQLIERAKKLKTKKRFMFPQWLKFGSTFVAGAVMCAAIIVPVLETPDLIQGQDNGAEPKMALMSGGKVPMENRLRGKMAIKSLRLDDAEDIQEFKIAPMMAKEMAAPMMLRSVPQEEALMVAAGTLNSAVGAVEQADVLHEPIMLNRSVDSRMMERRDELVWEDMPSDAEILRVATEFFENHNFDSFGEVAPRIDKWWDNNEESDWKPEFAPERVGVVFSIGHGVEDIRIDVETRTLKVVWMTYRQI